MSEVQCSYIFEFNTSHEQRYDLYFDSTTMNIADKSFAGQTEESMKWAELQLHQCSHCPLSVNEHKYCPTARALGRVAKKFSDMKSFKETKVAVITPDRTYLKQTTTQEALQSIFGLIMATSGCPHLNFLKPMARFHLPFANLNETMVRILSFYILRQYFNHEDKSNATLPQTFDFNLKPLSEAYEKVSIVNSQLIERLRSLGKGDADLNAVIILDAFASMLSFQISENFSELRPFFCT